MSIPRGASRPLESTYFRRTVDFAHYIEQVIMEVEGLFEESKIPEYLQNKFPENHPHFAGRSVIEILWEDGADGFRAILTDINQIRTAGHS